MSLKRCSSWSGSGRREAAVVLFSSFEVEETPNISILDLTSSDICIGSSSLVQVSSSLSDGTYFISYDIRGINNHVNNLDTIVSLSGSSSFIVDSDLLSNSGTTDVVITKITKAFDAGCASRFGEFATTTFNVENTPDTAGIFIYALDGCEGQDITVLGLSSLEDGNYEITYSLTGKNIGGPYMESISLTNSNGVFGFLIPETFIPITGATTITITQIDNQSGEMCSIGSAISSNFTLAPNPNVNNMVIDGQDICLGDEELISLSSDLPNGSYIFTGNIIGDNPTANLELEVTLSNGDGTGLISIPSNIITKVGMNTFEIIDVYDTEGANCNTSVAGVETDFEIQAIPIVDSLKVRVQSVCLGADARVDVLGNLADGTYTLSYTLSGDNVVIEEVIGLSITSGDGSGSFLIPSSLIPNSGTTFLAITSIAIDGGLNCELPINITDDFVVVSLTLSFDANLIARDICLGDSANIEVLTNLPDHIYAFTYDLSGANNYNDLQDTVEVSSSLASFTIKDTALTNNGTQKVAITGVTVLGIESCSVNGLTVDTTFDIQGALSISEQPIADNRCNGSSIQISSSGQNEGPGQLIYRWMESQDGIEFKNMTDEGVYSGTNSTTLNISNNRGLDGYYYQLLLSTSICKGVESDSVQIEVLTGSKCGDGLEFIPNGISPNGDGLNDFWEIEGIENYDGNVVKVYNRWGQLVYTGNNYNNKSIRFEGVNDNGNELVDGTYFYQIEYEGNELESGYLVIAR